MQLVFTHGNLRQALARSRRIPARLYIGFIIRRLRELGGRTQGGLAGLAEANISYLSSVESGLNNISIKKIWLVCNALQLLPETLVGIHCNIESSIDIPDGKIISAAIKKMISEP